MVKTRGQTKDSKSSSSEPSSNNNANEKSCSKSKNSASFLPPDVQETRIQIQQSIAREVILRKKANCNNGYGITKKLYEENKLIFNWLQYPALNYHIRSLEERIQQHQKEFYGIETKKRKQSLLSTTICNECNELPTNHKCHVCEIPICAPCCAKRNLEGVFRCMGCDVSSWNSDYSIYHSSSSNTTTKSNMGGRPKGSTFAMSEKKRDELGKCVDYITMKTKEKNRVWLKSTYLEIFFLISLRNPKKSSVFMRITP